MFILISVILWDFVYLTKGPFKILKTLGCIHLLPSKEVTGQTPQPQNTWVQFADMCQHWAPSVLPYVLDQDHKQPPKSTGWLFSLIFVELDGTSRTHNYQDSTHKYNNQIFLSIWAYLLLEGANWNNMLWVSTPLHMNWASTLLWHGLLLSAVMNVGLETSLGDRTTSVVIRIFKTSKAHSHALPKAYYQSFENLLALQEQTAFTFALPLCSYQAPVSVLVHL